MRSYPTNSPQAAARIAALTVVADGDIGDAEIEWLDRLAVHEQLGLARHELHALLDTFCEDSTRANRPCSSPQSSIGACTVRCFGRRSGTHRLALP